MCCVVLCEKKGNFDFATESQNGKSTCAASFPEEEREMLGDANVAMKGNARGPVRSEQGSCTVTCGRVFNQRTTHHRALLLRFSTFALLALAFDSAGFLCTCRALCCSFTQAHQHKPYADPSHTQRQAIHGRKSYTGASHTQPQPHRHTHAHTLSYTYSHSLIHLLTLSLTLLLTHSHTLLLTHSLTHTHPFPTTRNLQLQNPLLFGVG